MKRLINPLTLEVQVREALQEDIGRGDLTSALLIAEELTATADINAVEGGTVAGHPVAACAFRLLDENVNYIELIPDGGRAKPGDRVAEVTGPAPCLLTAERVALNFLRHLSGIATMTEKFVAKSHGVKITDTRKTTPGLRMLERYAVLMGGGYNHRYDLSSSVLIKDNHLTLMQSPEPVKRAIDRIRRMASPTVKIEVEVETFEDLEAAIAAGPDIIQLDNMSLDEIRQAVGTVNRLSEGRIQVEASGEVNLDNVEEIAKAGPDLISVGAITHSAPSLNLSMEIRHIWSSDAEAGVFLEGESSVVE